MTTFATRTWSPQQEDALRAVRSWLADRRGPQVFTLFGFAGTGKTTLAIEVASMVGDCLFATFTGKAALVMRRKGCDEALTIHSLIYNAVETSEGFEFKINHSSALRGADLLIVDECSMVDGEIGRDLLSFRTKVLVLGDPAQLPPVAGAGFFTSVPEPHVMLTEIHRQAAGNPIVALATKVREGGRPTPGTYRDAEGKPSLLVTRRASVTDASLLAADQIICGTNASRKSLNLRVRKLLRAAGRLPRGLVEDHMPVVGDKVICLRNDHDLGIFNGGMFRVQRVDAKDPSKKRSTARSTSYLTLSNEDEPEMRPVNVRVPNQFWQGTEATLDKAERRRHHEFDFGYAITCHKSQGSQWSKVLVYDDSFIFNRDGEEAGRRWLYTAITRAADRLIVAL